MNKNITFGTKITALRKEKGYRSQKEFAEALGVSTTTINYYENDERKPDYEMFQRIADLLDVSYDYLLGKSECKKRENIDIEKRLGLNESSIEHLSNFSGKGPFDILNLIISDDLFFELVREIYMYVSLDFNQQAIKKYLNVDFQDHFKYTFFSGYKEKSLWSINNILNDLVKKICFNYISDNIDNVDKKSLIDSGMRSSVYRDIFIKEMQKENNEYNELLSQFKEKGDVDNGFDNEES